MHIGMGLETASGVLHEIDIVARHQDVTAIFELKNRKGTPPDKNDVIVFFAKILDYLAANPMLLSKNVCLAFISSGSYDPSGLAACLGLGIHPVGADIRPLPILVQTATIMESELRNGISITSDLLDRFEDLCASLNRLSIILDGTWLDNRCGWHSDESILLKAVSHLPSMAIAQQIRQLNSDCTDILREFRLVKVRE